MNLRTIEQLIADDENQSLEFKQSIAELDKLSKTLCGFLNTDGGVGVLGVTDKRKLIGIEVTEKTKNKLSSIRNHFDPWPMLKIHYIPLSTASEKFIVAIEARASRDGMPFSYKGTPYLRNEAQLLKMPAELYKQRLLKTARFIEEWESMSAKPKFSIKHLDHDEIMETIKVALDEKRIPGRDSPCDVEEALISLDLISSGRLSHAAMVLFAKDMPADYPQCFLRMGRFTDETMNSAMDSKQVRGNAIELLEEAETFVRKHLPMSSRFDPNSMRRIDELALPFLAVREAMVNALCHRDYADRAGDISLLIFHTHLEVHNIGHLYGDMTVSKLKKRHPSRRRNPKIANVFYLRKWIDRYGSGTLRMIEMCREQDLPLPEFREDNDGFMVKFTFREPIGSVLSLPVGVDTSSLTERQYSILQILAKAGVPLSLRKIVELMDDAPPASRTLRDDFAKLKSLKLIDTKGFAKSSVWIIVENK